MSDQKKQLAVQHFIGFLCLFDMDGDVFQILAKRRGLPFGPKGEILTEKPYQKAALVKIIKEYGQPAEELKAEQQQA